MNSVLLGLEVGEFYVSASTPRRSFLKVKAAEHQNQYSKFSFSIAAQRESSTWCSLLHKDNAIKP